MERKTNMKNPTDSERTGTPAVAVKHIVRRRVRLQFMVVPELLATKAYVPDAVRCCVIDPQAIFLTGLLGESGRKLVKAGIEFYFTRSLAEKLISKGIAVESPNEKS